MPRGTKRMVEDGIGVVIKNLEPEVIQPWPKPSRMLYFSCNIPD